VLVGEDHRPSGGKGKTPVGPHLRLTKLTGAFERATSVIWKKNIDNVWQGARNLLLILRI